MEQVIQKVELAAYKHPDPNQVAGHRGREGI